MSYLFAALPVVLAAVFLVRGHGGWPLAFVRSVALGSAGVVVGAELLPAAFEALGLMALAVAVGCFGLVWAVDARMHAHRGGALGAVGAVAVHQVVHGAELAAFADVLGPGGWLAMSAHALPLVAVALLGVAGEGRRAVGVWGGLLGMSLLGVALGEQLPEAWVEQAEPWLRAALVGVLLHVLMHLDVDPEHHRLADLAGWLGGGAAVWALLGGMHEAPPLPTGARLAFGDALFEVAVETAPMLLLGLGLAAAVQARSARLPAGWLAAPSRGVQAARGAVLAAPLPLCACGVMPLAQGLAARSATPALVTAFVVATPELGLETLLVSARFLGWPLALLRLGAVLLAAVLAGVLVDRWVGGGPPSVGDSHLHQDPPHGTAWHRGLHAFDELVLHTGPFVLMGLVLAALAEAFVTDVPQASGLGPVAAVALVAVPAVASGAGAMPLAGVLWAKGLSAAAVVTGLVVGPATSLAGLAFLGRRYGAAASALAVLSVCTVGVAAGGLVGLLGWSPVVVVPEAAGHAHGWAGYAMAWGLAATLLASLVQHGSSAWLGQLAGGVGHASGVPHAHVAACDHAHAHAHHGHAH